MILKIQINEIDKLFTYQVNNNIKISDIKLLIQQNENILIKYQNLLYNNKIIENENITLIDLKNNNNFDYIDNNIEEKTEKKLKDNDNEKEIEILLNLSLCIDSGYEMRTKFINLQTIPDIFEQIVDVKIMNEELFRQIKQVKEVKKMHYVAKYQVDEHGNPSFLIEETIALVKASKVLVNFQMDGTLTTVKDYFNDKISYNVASINDLGRINESMFTPVTKFVEMFSEGSAKMRAVMFEYGANYCTIYQNLMRVLKVELADEISKQDDLNVHANIVMDQLQLLGVKGVKFSPPLLPLCIFPYSKILLDNSFDCIIKNWLIEKGESHDLKPLLLYQSSRDGQASNNFHSCCDNKGSTLTIIKCTSGYIFGGYASIPWTSRGNYNTANNSFLFSLINPANAPPQKYDLQLNNPSAIYDQTGYGPTFGGGHDIYVGNNWQGCYVNFPSSYRDFTGRGQATFTGARNFTPVEIEVWKVNERN